MSELQALIDLANLARSRARAPFSRYPVGAAVLADSGKIYPGCNIESAAFPTTLCAERVAIFNAIASGETGFKSMVITTLDGGTPCGACRQVIHEQCGNITIHLVKDGDSEPVTYTVEQLLPHPFEDNGRIG